MRFVLVSPGPGPDDDDNDDDDDDHSRNNLISEMQRVSRESYAHHASQYDDKPPPAAHGLSHNYHPKPQWHS